MRRAHRRAYAPHLVPEVQHDDLPYPAATPQSILVEKRCVFEVISPPHLPGISGEMPSVKNDDELRAVPCGGRCRGLLQLPHHAPGPRPPLQHVPNLRQAGLRAAGRGERAAPAANKAPAGV